MKNNILLPYRFKLIGLFLLLPSLVAGIAVLFFDWQWPALDIHLPKWLIGGKGGLMNLSQNNLTDEITFTFVVIGMLIMCFSREKREDEYIMHTRLESLQWAVLIHFIVLLCLVWLVYNDNFWYVIILSNVTIPVIFLLRFHWLLFINNQNPVGPV